MKTGSRRRDSRTKEAIMDLFSHGLLPYLFGNFFKRKKDEIIALALGGIALDIDIFLLWINVKNKTYA